MAWTNVGFDGTINEAEWSRLSGLLGNSYVAAGNGDCLVTAVAGARSVSVAAGSLYGDGVLSTNSAPETVAMTTPVNGQWYVIALRRTWATNTAALVAIAGATTSTTTPTAPPTSFPTLNTNVGVLTDQPIAWAWCNSANTTVVVYDIRLKAVKSLPPVVANANERDAKFMSPTQGLQVWRDDLGAVETYYGLYNASTNPGGRDSAGWYSTDRAGGLVPIKPSTVTFIGGTGTVSALGKISTTTPCSKITLQGVFSAKYTSYKIVIHNIYEPGGNSASVYFRYANAGTENASSYNWNRLGLDGTNNLIYGGVNAAGEMEVTLGGNINGAAVHGLITKPFLAARTNATFTGYSGRGSLYGGSNFSTHDNTGSFDGFSIWFSGYSAHFSFSVYGIND